MNIIKTLPITATESAILEAKRDGIYEKTLSFFLIFCFIIIFVCFVPGKHGKPSLFATYGFNSILTLETLLSVVCVASCFFQKRNVDKDLKRGKKTVAAVFVKYKVPDLSLYHIVTTEKGDFEKIAVDKQSYHRYRKGDAITLDFAPFSAILFSAKSNM